MRASTSERLDRGFGRAEDLVGTYLDEVGRHPLLTKEDEVRLAQTIEAGTNAAAVLDDPQLTEARRLELQAEVDAGAQAEATFVRSNLRLVVSMAKRRRASGVALLDLIQEGNLGLIHAVRKFDWRKGFRFSTYAGWWIRDSMSRAMAGAGRPVRIPTHVEHDVALLDWARARLEASSGTPITASTLGAEAGMDEARAARLLEFRVKPVLLSVAVHQDSDVELGEALADGSVPSAIDLLTSSLLPGVVARLMTTLDGREQEVLRLRFGLDGSRPHTLGELGDHLGLTRERVRQIEKAALSKLRRPAAEMGVPDLLAG
ncbi:MAG TPA: sigma-70 family RNA polymerase sigma factor [Acidimicrobiales bacterium]|nr:sigma-70 family RNA polymerase sigma factor [Acidimicrobiales bacterium]